MLGLINDLMDQAKIDSQTFCLSNGFFNLVEVVQRVFQTIQFHADNRNVRLALELDASRPFLLRKVFSDERRVQQILLNFLSNSLKFTSNGDVRVKLKVLQEQNYVPSDSSSSQGMLKLL